MRFYLKNMFSPFPANSKNEAFYSAYWSRELDPHNYTHIAIVNTFGIWYLHLDEPLPIKEHFKWYDNWDGTLLGNKVRGEVFYLSSDEVSLSQTGTRTIETATTLGVAFGGNKKDGANAGFTWNSKNTQEVKSSVTITASPKDKSIGTFDMNYCESNTLYIIPNTCKGILGGGGIDDIKGTNYPGAMEIWTYINK